MTTILLNLISSLPLRFIRENPRAVTVRGFSFVYLDYLSFFMLVIIEFKRKTTDLYF